MLWVDCALVLINVSFSSSSFNRALKSARGKWRSSTATPSNSEIVGSRTSGDTPCGFRSIASIA
ncbi:MAG: hypothetical protein DMF76_27105 [Acidobacteria bacterium]|nr:MAG: hypothetical protein DMF76_27105 [Acidobacteriota bacterium]